MRAIVRHLPFDPTAHLAQLPRRPVRVRSCHTIGTDPRSRLLLASTLWVPRSEACARIGRPSAPVSIRRIRRCRARSYQHQAPFLFFFACSSPRTTPTSLSSSFPNTTMAVVGQFGYGSEVLFISSEFCLELGRRLAPIHQSPRRGLLGNSGLPVSRASRLAPNVCPAPVQGLRYSLWKGRT